MKAAAVAVATAAGDTLDPMAWEEVLKLNPSNHLALSKLADIARMQGRHLEAAGYLERLLAVGMPSDGARASSEPAGLGGPRSQGEVHAALGHCFLAVSHQESELSGILRRMQESHDAYKLALTQMAQGEDPDLHAGQLSTIAGWGDTTDSESTQSFPTILQVVEVPVLSEAECDADLSGITDGMICAAYPSGGYDACQGDSGGPM